jgi:hypothetical protein
VDAAIIGEVFAIFESFSKNSKNLEKFEKPQKFQKLRIWAGECYNNMGKEVFSVTITEILTVMKQVLLSCFSIHRCLLCLQDARISQNSSKTAATPLITRRRVCECVCGRHRQPVLVSSLDIYGYN